MVFTCNFWSRSLLKLLTFFILFISLVWTVCGYGSVCMCVAVCVCFILSSCLGDDQYIHWEIKISGVLRVSFVWDGEEKVWFVCTWRECFVALLSSSCEGSNYVMLCCFFAILVALLLAFLILFLFCLLACFCYED